MPVFYRLPFKNQFWCCLFDCEALGDRIRIVFLTNNYDFSRSNIYIIFVGYRIMYAILECCIPVFNCHLRLFFTSVIGVTIR